MQNGVASIRRMPTIVLKESMNSYQFEKSRAYNLIKVAIHIVKNSSSQNLKNAFQNIIFFSLSCRSLISGSLSMQAFLKSKRSKKAKSVNISTIEAVPKMFYIGLDVSNPISLV